MGIDEHLAAGSGPGEEGQPLVAPPVGPRAGGDGAPPRPLRDRQAGVWTARV